MEDTTSDFKDQKWLICQPMFSEIIGSTILSLELAEYLQDEGAEVRLYSYYIGSPMEKIAQSKGIKFIEHSNFKAQDFDYIWSNSQCLPRFIMDNLRGLKGKTNPVFLFAHLSSLKFIAPDEFPISLFLEERLASMNLFVSKEALGVQKPFFNEKLNPELFENPAPVKFGIYIHERRKNLKRILMVSNHLPKELDEAKEILEESGVLITQLGWLKNDYKLIEPEFLAQFDVVITIGKTVQYCLCEGIPVYVYDHFSGDGYLTEENFDENRQNNFSGRKRGNEWAFTPRKKKSGKEIVEELFTGYQSAVDFHTSKRKEMIENFSISNVLPKIIKSIRSFEFGEFTVSEVLNLIEMQVFSKRAFRNQVLLGKYKKAISQLQEQLKNLK